MEFLQLLAAELTEWPKGNASHLVCSASGEIFATKGGAPVFDGSDSNLAWTILGVGCGEYVYWEDIESFTLSSVPADHSTAIVTRTQWEAERAKLKAPKANGDGWVRHRGRSDKCPVPAGTLVDYVLRGGREIFGVSAETRVWKHHQESSDIMRYKIHKPAKQPESQSADDHPGLKKISSSFEKEPGVRISLHNPLEWRDRIRELDTQRAEVESTYQRQIGEITQERESLVQKLAGEGLALVEVVAQPVEDMSDWRNWKAGDLVECVSILDKHCASLTLGKIYQYKGQGYILDDDCDEQAYPVRNGKCFKWHSRPVS